MEIRNYVYTKENGEVSNRKLFPVNEGAKPPPVRALDLTGFTDEAAAHVVDLYGQWTKEVKKPFDKKASAFQKENLITFEEYIRAAGFEHGDTILKSFIATGLNRVS